MAFLYDHQEFPSVRSAYKTDALDLLIYQIIYNSQYTNVVQINNASCKTTCSIQARIEEGPGCPLHSFPGLRKSTTPPFFAERKSRLIGERAFTWVGGVLMSLIFDTPPPHLHTHAQTLFRTISIYLHYASLIESKSVDMEVG